MAALLRRLGGFEGGKLQKGVRMSVKVWFCSVVCRFGLDLFERYMIPDQFMSIPRVLNVIDSNHRALPPMTTPFIEDEQSRQQNKLHEQMVLNCYGMVMENYAWRYYLYNDYPKRENPDRIDAYMRLGLTERRKQITRLKIAERLEKEGVQLLNINNFIRRLEQPELEKLKGPIIPQL